MRNPRSVEQLARDTIRTLALDAVQRANSGHPGMPMGMADTAFVLWTQFLQHDPSEPGWLNRDRVVLSAGHGSMLLYALLHLCGYDLPMSEIMRFRQWGSMTPGHPEHGHPAGVETTTGPLGQGFGNAVGLAMAERFLAATFNRPGLEVIDHRTYAIASDGDMMEGVSSEAASLAGHLQLGKLIVLYDDNRITIEGSTDLAFSEDVGKRFAAYSWQVIQADGHQPEEVGSALREAVAHTDQPSLIICRTHIAYGSPNKQGTADAHGAPLGEEEVLLTKERLGWPAETAFLVPDEVRQHFGGMRRLWQAEREDWDALYERYAAEYPDDAARLQVAWRGDLPAAWEERLPAFRSEGMEATRNASGRVLTALAPHMPTLLGGSADLAPSTKTYVSNLGDFAAGRYEARNLRFGVREHAMGAILNGLALHGGIRPYGGTFLVFSDYMRPSIRLGAMMRLPVIYVFTHDSIYVGEDGPTHQPIEHLAALRAIPHLTVIRPADANETIVAWKVALEQRDGPVALILSRQNLPSLAETASRCQAGLPRGGYILSEPVGVTPDISLIATGSEVSLALAAARHLENEGINPRVVSLPSWELFDGQSAAYRDEVLLEEGHPRLAIEAGATLGWCRYLGRRGDIIGIDHFGASAPAEVLGEKFGFTTKNVVQRARQLLGVDEP